MKKIILIAAILFGVVISSQKAQAQVRVGFSINIGTQPLWGPAGYDYAEYYFLPDLDVYYYVPEREFIYRSDGRWISSMSLPPRYRGYDLYSGYKVVINEPRPYLHDNRYREKYSHYRVRHQLAIRNSREWRYRHDHHYGRTEHERRRNYENRHERHGHRERHERHHDRQ